MADSAIHSTRCFSETKPAQPQSQTKAKLAAHQSKTASDKVWASNNEIEPGKHVILVALLMENVTLGAMCCTPTWYGLRAVLAWFASWEKSLHFTLAYCNDL